MTGSGRSAVGRRTTWWVRETWSTLVDLVLPAACPGCEGPAGTGGLCRHCGAALLALAPGEVRPTPAPAGLPVTCALGAYDGPLRAAILAYKERARHGLAAPLGAGLAHAVAGALDARRGRPPVLLVPAPSTARAVRARRGDHMLRLATVAAGRLRADGWPVAVVRPLRARGRHDSAVLSSAERLSAARSAVVIRPRALAPVRAAVSAGAVAVLVDDVMTTGATLAVMATRLRAAGVPVSAAAVLAATRRRGG